jgi:hypothetical protein
MAVSCLRARKPRPIKLRARPRIDVLEDRSLLSTILWTNRGNAFSDSDGFNGVFGANATAARAVVDAAIQAWQNVIVNFNFAGGGNTFKLTVSVNPSEIGNGALAWSGLENDGNGKPTAGKIQLDAGWDGHGAGYYLDANMFSPAFAGNILAPYAREATPGSSAVYLGDLFTVMVHEMTHVLGINTDPQESFQKNLNGYLRNTWQPDGVDAGGTLFVFEGPSVRALLTSDDNIFGGVAVPAHMAKPGNSYTDPVTQVTYSGTLDVLNSSYAFGRRVLISATDALILKDAYGYTITLPPTFWAGMPAHVIATGTGVGGSPQVQVFDGATGAWKLNFFAYDANFKGGVRVAVGDVNRDGSADIITAPGPGMGPLVRVFDGKTGTLIREFYPYSTTLKSGVAVGVGDINGDGFVDIITAPLAGNPDIRIYSGKDVSGIFNPLGNSLLAQWFAYGLNFNVGANVAVGDVNHDGYADIVTGASAGNPHVKVYNGRDIAAHAFKGDGSLLGQWFAYALQFNVGATVSIGDVSGDGYADVITGATLGNPDVRIYDGRDVAMGMLNGSAPAGCLLANFFVYGLQYNIGAHVAAADVNGDGYADIVTGTTAGSPHVKVYKGVSIASGIFNNFNPDASLLQNFFASSQGLTAGVAVGASA